MQEGKLGKQKKAKGKVNHNTNRNIEQIREQGEEVEEGEAVRSINFQTLKVATHNINGIKGNTTKLELLAKWAKEERIDILGINESNIDERQGKFCLAKSSEYISFWTSAEEGKLKGSGVGLIINRIWEKHIGKITRYSSYYIDALLVFKKVKILVIIAYIPPSDKEIKKLLQQHIIKKIRENERKNTKIIIIGDFNDIRSKT